MHLNEKWQTRVKKYSESRFFFPIIASLAFADLFVAFIPTDLVLITAAYLRPKNRFRAALWVTSGSALGALLMAWIVSIYGDPFLTGVLGFDLHSSRWIQAENLINKYGFWGIAFIAIGPLPQQPTVAVSGLMHLSIFKIALAVFVGRLPKYLFFAWAAIKAPQWLGLKQLDQSKNLS